MKKIIFALILCFAFCQINAQDNQDFKWNIEAHYPLSIGDNFINEGFNGIIGIDVRYTMFQTPLVDFKFGVIADYYNYDFIETFNGNAFIIKPKILGEFHLSSKITPYLSIGYSIMTSKINTGNIFDFNDPDDPFFDGNDGSFTDNGYGFNFGLGLKYNINEQFFLQSAVDFLSLEPQDDVPNTSYNKNIQTVYFGVGINL